MIRLTLLGGKRAGEFIETRRFPFTAGRAAEVEFRLEEPGVWDRHFTLTWGGAQGVRLKNLPPARTLVNGVVVEDTALRNWDVLQVGELRLLFSLSSTRQRTFRAREVLTWTAVALLCAAQIVLIYHLLP